LGKAITVSQPGDPACRPLPGFFHWSPKRKTKCICYQRPRLTTFASRVFQSQFRVLNSATPTARRRRPRWRRTLSHQFRRPCRPKADRMWTPTPCPCAD